MYIHSLKNDKIELISFSRWINRNSNGGRIMTEKIENRQDSLWNKIKYMAGFHKNPRYIEDRLKEADVRSALILTVAVVFMETFMLLRYVKKYVITGKCETVGEFFQYTYVYWILLITSVLLCIYSIMYMKGKLKVLNKYSRPLIFIYYLIGIYFGIRTSLVDFSKGKMITCFLAMSLYVTFIFVVRPFISLILMSISCFGFIELINLFAYNKEGEKIFLESGDFINYITFFITITVLYISIYFQRYRDAQKAYKLEIVAKTDSLTGAPNMDYFEKISADYIRDSYENGVTPIYLSFDIQHFQTYNDHYTHAQGDNVLKDMALILDKVFGEELYARQYADKFVALTSVEESKNKVMEVKKALREKHQAETYLDVIVGAYIPKGPEESPRQAMDCAKFAMNRVKNPENVLIAEYDEKSSADNSLRHYILNSLDAAISKGYIKPFYQPVIDSSDGTLCGCEALARWIDPEKGFLSPGQFIPFLEESRQIHKLDRCIYEMVFKRMRESFDAGLPVVPVSLNFSRLDFELMDVVNELENLVDKYRIPKKYIHVEITESAVAQSDDMLNKSIHTLKDLGYAIWLDDFGSGYSSLNVLKDFQFDLIKIDMVFLRSFETNPNSRPIIKSVIDLANKLNMATLTEGVETQEAVDFLKEAGCGKLQGYFYGKPQTYEELLEKINDGTYKLSKSQ